MMGLFTKLLIANNSINCCKHRQAHNLPINGDYEPAFFYGFLASLSFAYVKNEYRFL